MDSMVEALKIKRTIKAILKRRRQTFQDVAKSLGLSHTTVKRILSNDELSLERLLQICSLLELSLEMLIEESNRLPSPSAEGLLSSEQEELLAANQPLFLYFNKLRNGAKPAQIQEQFALTARSQNHYLRELEKARIIDYTNRGHVTLRAWKWAAGGCLFQMMTRKTTSGLCNFITRKALAGEMNPVQKGRAYISYSDYNLSTEAHEEYDLNVKTISKETEQKYLLEKSTGRLEDRTGRLYRLVMHYFEVDNPADQSEFRSESPFFGGIPNVD
jgi:transcriptional regulator with XRE-family HTH domain